MAFASGKPKKYVYIYIDRYIHPSKPNNPEMPAITHASDGPRGVD